jgi:hypothetical protein
VAAREAICGELEALETAVLEPRELLAKVRDVRARWQREIAARGVDRERAAALDQRFAEAFGRVLAAAPAAFAGTDLDPDANRRRLESLTTRMEDLAKSVSPAGRPLSDEALSPTTRAAAMLKEALAANTIGGKVDDGSRLRAALDEVRQAQAAWARVGPVSDQVRRPLADRFQRACQRIVERAGSPARAGKAGAFS